MNQDHHLLLSISPSNDPAKQPEKMILHPRYSYFLLAISIPQVGPVLRQRHMFVRLLIFWVMLPDPLQHIQMAVLCSRRTYAAAPDKKGFPSLSSSTKENCLFLDLTGLSMDVSRSSTFCNQISNNPHYPWEKIKEINVI